MKYYVRIVMSIFIAFLPSSLKIVVMRLSGKKIGKYCYIGFSLIDAQHVEIGDGVRIGHFNLIKDLSRLKMMDGSKIEGFNWITGAGKGSLHLGENSSVRRFHFFESSGSIYIGANTIIAGRGSLFFTHGITPNNLNDVREIKIGDWCYIGAAVRFLPGSGVSNYTFVGMGSVITKMHTDNFCVMAGSPAKMVKKLTPNCAYFSQHRLTHSHHTAEYLRYKSIKEKMI